MVLIRVSMNLVGFFTGLLWFVCRSRAWVESLESFACCFPAAIVIRPSDFAGAVEAKVTEQTCVIAVRVKRFRLVRQ